MPKRRLTIKNWSGGINNRKDPRDISDSESSYIQDMSIDSLGKIKTIGGLYDAIEGSDGTTDLSEYIVSRTSNIEGSGGYGLFYFESDHSGSSEQTITETKGGTALNIGTSNGNISFHRVASSDDTPADIPDLPS
tara:strand:- start:9577 stop:9981 length:405 start_codon:yes stop_codon:yes gene_type:complete